MRNYSSNLNDESFYGVTEAARYLRIPVATLRSWVAGRSYPGTTGKGFFEPVIQPVNSKPIELSFNNLIEAHILRALRTRYSVPLDKIRTAIKYAERTLGVDRLLLYDGLRSVAGDVLIEKYGELINLSRSGQIAMKKILDAYLDRIERDESMMPVRLYPYVELNHSRNGAHPIVIDPKINFGRPVLNGRGVATEAIVERIDVGEPVELVLKDYNIRPEELEIAILYERAA